jgi:hypothetical protein
LQLEHQLECSLAVMSASQMHVKDSLAGARNWSPWKARIVFILEDLELWDIVEVHVVVPPATAPILLEEFRKRNNKEKRMICDSVRDHIIPHLTGKYWAYEMWASLCKLYQSSNENQKMVLHDRLRGIRMLKDESVTSFLGQCTKIRIQAWSHWRGGGTQFYGEDNLKQLYQTMGSIRSWHCCQGGHAHMGEDVG